MSDDNRIMSFVTFIRTMIFRRCPHTPESIRTCIERGICGCGRAEKLPAPGATDPPR